MSNSFSVLIPIIVASLQRVLRNTGALLNAVTLDAQATAAGLNQTINLPASAAAASYDVSPGAVPPALVDTTPTTKTLTLSQYKGSRFHVTGEEWRAIGVRGPDFRMSQVDECIAVLVDGITAYVGGIADAGVSWAEGAAASSSLGSNPDALMTLWKRLSDSKAPNRDRFGVVTTAEWAALGNLDQFQKLQEAPRGVDFATGQIGMLANFVMGWAQDLPTHAVGTNDGNYLVNNGAGYPVGATAIALDTGAGTILAGDVVSFAAATDRYVVESFVAPTLTLRTPLRVAIADNNAVVVQAAHKSNLFMHKDCLTAAVRPPAEAPDGDSATAVAIIPDPVTGVALRLAQYKGYHATQFELSVVYGATVRRPTLGAKLIGPQ